MGVTYNNRIVTDGLVLCLDAASKRSYPGTGTVWTDLAGANDGTLTNGPTFDSGNGGSIVFDGGNDRVATSTISLGSTFSAFFMLKFDGYNAVLAGGSSWNDGGYIFWVENSSSMYFSTTDGFSIINPSLSTNQWTHLGITRNGTSCTFYKNGTSLVTTSCGNGSLSIGAIGAYTGGAYAFNGSMSSFVIYNKELSADEIRRNYLSTKERFA